MDSAQGQDQGLVAYWNFDEGSGLRLTDRSGNGHDGLVKGAQWVPGKINGALSFEKGGWVEIPDHQELQLKTDFTMTAWIKKTQTSEKGKSMGIISKSSKDAWDFDLFMSTSKLEHPAFFSDAFKAPGGDIEVISSKPIKLNQWQHIAVTRKGSKAKIYLDGVIAGTAILPEELGTSSKNIFIGHDQDGRFVGIIDEVHIYNRELADQEIKALMNNGNGLYTGLSFNHIIIDSSFGGIRAIADIDGDKYQDIVHCFWYNSASLAWYEYKDAQTWTKHVIAENFYPVTDNFDMSDMDADGDPDIIMAQSESKRSDDPKADDVKINEVRIVWFENPRPNHDPRTFIWKQHLVGSHVDSHENYIKDIKAVDFTGNGTAEIVVRSNIALSIFRMENPNAWVQMQYIEIHPHEGMDVGDIDNDGDPDVVLNGFWFECPDNPRDHWPEHTIDKKWYNQTGDWTANNCKVLVKDINGDGRADVVLSHSERPGYPVSWYEAHRSDKNLWKENVIDTVDYCHTLQAADMDMDGDTDVVVGEMEKSAEPDQIIVILNDGDGLSWKKQVVKNNGIYSGKVADIGNDGDPDIIANRNFDKAPLELWENLIINKSSGRGNEKP